MQRIMLIGLLFVLIAPCNASLEVQLSTLLEDASLLLHNFSRQRLLWQCNATRARHRMRVVSPLVNRWARGEAETVVLKLPTLSSLVELLSQLAEPNGIPDEVFR